MCVIAATFLILFLDLGALNRDRIRSACKLCSVSIHMGAFHGGVAQKGSFVFAPMQLVFAHTYFFICFSHTLHVLWMIDALQCVERRL